MKKKHFRVDNRKTTKTQALDILEVYKNKMSDAHDRIGDGPVKNEFQRALFQAYSEAYHDMKELFCAKDIVTEIDIDETLYPNLKNGN